MLHQTVSPTLCGQILTTLTCLNVLRLKQFRGNFFKGRMKLFFNSLAGLLEERLLDPFSEIARLTAKANKFAFVYFSSTLCPLMSDVLDKMQTKQRRVNK